MERKVLVSDVLSWSCFGGWGLFLCAVCVGHISLKDCLSLLVKFGLGTKCTILKSLVRCNVSRGRAIFNGEREFCKLSANFLEWVLVK